jgi:hypothetical protein
MRWVSWIVVMGAVAWLLYTQLWTQVPDEHREKLETGRLQGTVTSMNDENAGAGETDVVPYDAIYPMIEAVETVADLDRIEVSVIIRSRSRNVDPEAIILSLDDGATVHQFTVGQYGAVTFPLRADWRGEGFLIRSNQPAGTLDLQVTFILKTLPGRQVEYAWLWETVRQLDVAITAMQGVQAAPPGEVVGLILEYKPGERGQVIAGEGAGAATLTADERGVLRLELTEELLAENPTLVFSPLPQRLVPLIDAPEA